MNYIGSAVLTILGLVVLISSICTGGSIGMIVVGALLTFSGVLSFFTAKLEKKTNKENKND